MEFTKQVTEVGGCIRVTIPKEIVKFYDINSKDLCTFEFVRNLRDGNGSR